MPQTHDQGVKKARARAAAPGPITATSYPGNDLERLARRLVHRGLASPGILEVPQLRPSAWAARRVKRRGSAERARTERP